METDLTTQQLPLGDVPFQVQPRMPPKERSAWIRGLPPGVHAVVLVSPQGGYASVAELTILGSANEASLRVQNGRRITGTSYRRVTLKTGATKADAYNTGRDQPVVEPLELHAERIVLLHRIAVALEQAFSLAPGQVPLAAAEALTADPDALVAVERVAAHVRASRETHQEGWVKGCQAKLTAKGG